VASGAGWNERLIKAGGHLLQSREWGEFKSRHGWTPDRITVEGPDGYGMAQVLYRFKGPVSVGYIPRGPAISGNAAAIWPELRARIDESARRHRAISVILEPNEPLGLDGTFRESGLVAGPSHLQPGRTVKIPLGDDEAILKQMHQKTRYNVRLAQRRGVTMRHCDAWEQSIDTFYELLQDTAGRNEFGIHSRPYYADFLDIFGDNTRLIFAEADGHVGAALIACAFGPEAIYMYGASSTEHRAHGAAFYMQFEAMRWARDRGCATYDLWGIPEQDPDSTAHESSSAIAGTRGDDWRGLYRFKTGFGGEIITYPQTLERRFVPVLPWAARKLGVIRG
jgi:lipid II:glycine glycyltransferase (peptidoglycan interpeptide bridge formation enzyme)